MNENRLKSVGCCQIQHNFRDGEDLCKLDKAQSNASPYKFCAFSIHSEALTYHTPFYH